MIVKKMSELKLLVDEDFAEYVMVMLHNNKSQNEVQTDLEPFLGTQSTVFTPWLFSMIEPNAAKPGELIAMEKEFSSKPYSILKFQTPQKCPSRKAS